MHHAKAAFLKTDFVPLLQTIPANTAPQWGKMSLQHMIEHFSDAVRIASGKIPDLPLFTPAEHLSKMQAFLETDKPMRENVHNPLMPETPAAAKHNSIDAALAELQIELNSFFETFATTPHRTTHNPFFGELGFAQNILLLYKHAQHHLRQFGVSIP